MNEPERFELFVLPDNVKKLTIEKDTRIQNAATFTVEREDHTIGNVVRMQLLRDPTVLFAGYRVPHPLEHHVLIKVQCTDESRPTLALSNSIRDLVSECRTLEERFSAELARKQRPERMYNL